jgi:hypothetical protein
MTDRLGRGPFPTTGHEAADAWIRDARGYIGIVATRCKNCHSRGHCRECLSLEARLLVQRHDDIRFGGSFESELDKMRKSVLSQFKGKTTIRGDMLEVPGLRNLHKTKFLASMASDGLLLIERKITGSSGHYSLYYSIPTTKTYNTQHSNNG